MKKKFENINSPLSKLLDQYNLTHIYSIEVIKKGWSEMDKTIAAHSGPIDYNPKTKVLKLKIENIAWKNEFLENKTMLVTKTRSFFKSIEIDDIKFI